MTREIGDLLYLIQILDVLYGITKHKFGRLKNCIYQQPIPMQHIFMYKLYLIIYPQILYESWVKECVFVILYVCNL